MNHPANHQFPSHQSNLTTDKLTLENTPGKFGADLASGEKILATLETDLDARLHFIDGVVILTNQRLAARNAASETWQQWSLTPELRLEHFDHAGVGTLALFDGARRLAHWRYTLGQNLAALRLIKEFGKQRDAMTHGYVAEGDAISGQLCPQCRAPLDPELDECPICAKEILAPPSTWTLLRLWRFAKPYNTQLLA